MTNPSRTTDSTTATCPPDVVYTLEVVVPDRRQHEVAAIALRAPGQVSTGLHTRQVPGWSRLRLVADRETTLRWLEQRIRSQLGFELVSCADLAIERSRGGKPTTQAKVPLRDGDDLAVAYTPGVGRVALRIAANPAEVQKLTGKDNRVAIVTDGTDVLGLGNLGPAAVLPVMEGKAAPFAHLAGIDAVPICLDTASIDQIVATVFAIAPSFGGINLEDIAAPGCFAVEARLRAALHIPVLHDDQHGTAVVVLAALRNALAVVGKRLDTARLVVLGAGAAGTAVTRLLLAAGAHDVLGWAPVGVLGPHLGPTLPPHKQELAAATNPCGVRGGLPEALRGADAVIGVSAAHLLSRELVASMASNPVVFALANPVPEIEPDQIADLAAVIATGRSDHPNPGEQRPGLPRPVPRRARRTRHQLRRRGPAGLRTSPGRPRSPAACRPAAARRPRPTHHASDRRRRDPNSQRATHTIRGAAMKRLPRYAGTGPHLRAPDRCAPARPGTGRRPVPRAGQPGAAAPPRAAR
jgi:malate dehydrogenase (oxaloacetate-decarboxylating)